MSLPEPVKAQIEAELAKSKVVLFMKGSKHFPQCGFSSQVVQILTTVGVPFETVNVLKDPAIRDGIKVYAEWPTIPQLYVDGQFVGGCDIVKDLYASGELGELLGAAPKEAPAPSIVIFSDIAKRAITSADDGSGDTLRLEVNVEFQYDLYFGPKETSDVETTASGVVVRMDRGTASRVNGLHIGWVEDQGGAFKIDNPNEPPRVRGLSVEGLQAMQTRGDAFELIDVRTDGERRTAKIEGARHLTEETESALLALPRDTVLVFHCHHGMRSRSAAEHFLREGFRKVWNLEGGIDAWSLKIDPSVARY
ncbi:MAG TPA: Grx4 family monothiol glutaredoxin [Polyangiaceae bacterium]|nr:Grx4 family monothiol glutaredoxin [Polyangiaceae bacterium]